MCAEGFDASRIRVVAYLTTVVTRSRFVQGITRAVRMCGERANLESIPREPSYVFAPADPLLMQYARSWSLLRAVSHCRSGSRLTIKTRLKSAAPGEAQACRWRQLRMEPER